LEESEQQLLKIEEIELIKWRSFKND
jgi:hypothetical protein